MNKITWVVVSVLLTPIRLQAQSDTFQSIAKRFLSAKERSYQQMATKESIDEVLNFCSDTIKYDHVLSPEKSSHSLGKSSGESVRYPILAKPGT